MSSLRKQTDVPLRADHLIDLVEKAIAFENKPIGSDRDATMLGNEEGRLAEAYRRGRMSVADDLRHILTKSRKMEGGS